MGYLQELRFLARVLATLGTDSSYWHVLAGAGMASSSAPATNAIVAPG